MARGKFLSLEEARRSEKIDFVRNSARAIAISGGSSGIVTGFALISEFRLRGLLRARQGVILPLGVPGAV